MIKSQKGITLVALIITIIVMLILAGVSISLVLDEGGVLNRAQTAEAEQVKGAMKEAVALANADILADFYSNTVGYDKTTVDIETMVEKNCSYTVDAKVNGTTGTVTARDVYDKAGDLVSITFTIDMDSARYPKISN